MASYYKSVVLKDMEEFWTDNAPTEYPVRQYAVAKGFDPDLFSAFYLKVCNAEPFYLELGNGSKTDTYFRLTNDEEVEYADFVSYFETVSGNKYWKYEVDDSGAIKNSANEIEKWYHTPRKVEGDPYDENRTHTVPKLMDKNGIIIPEKYDEEWYQHDHGVVTQKEWILDPTKEDTPFEDYKPHKYYDLSPFNNMHEKDDHRHFIRHK